MGAYSFDTETTGLDVHGDARMFAYSVCDTSGNTEVFRVDQKGKRKVAISYLKNFFKDTSKEKIMHNSKFDLLVVMKEGIKIPKNSVIHDTMIQSQLLRNLAPSHSLDYLCWELCGWSRELDKKISTMGKALGGYQHIPVPFMNKYQDWDAQRTQLLHQTFYPDIEKNPKLYKDYLNELALIRTTIRLEQHGILLSRNNCAKLIQWLQDELEHTREESFEKLGEYVNLNSSAQIARILYKKYNMPIIKLTKSKKPATDKATLAKLREDYPHEIHDLILKQRSYRKGLSMIEGYMDLAGKDDIIHPTINTNQARTGRESGSNPNMQNVSKNAALLNPFPVPSRKCFKTFPGHLLYLVDYSGIEMRLIINEAGEQELIEVVAQNGDVHAMAARVFYGELFDDLDFLQKYGVTQKVLRSAAKNANFAIPYGASMFKVFNTLGCEMLGISFDDFKHNHKKYCERWPGIAFFTRNIIEQVRENQYVETVFGRRLQVPLNKAYAGANYLIQGTAAGVLKRAQVKVDKYCENVLKDAVRIVIPIHDELILSYPKKLYHKRHKILKDISRIMTKNPEIKIKLDVEWKMTKGTWDEAKEIEVTY